MASARRYEGSVRRLEKILSHLCVQAGKGFPNSSSMSVLYLLKPYFCLPCLTTITSDYEVR